MSDTIKLAGIGEIPRYQDCTWCGKKASCAFVGVAYSQPCNECKNTPRYEREMDKPKPRSMAEMIAVNKPAGVFEGHGRRYITNNKGDVIRDEPLNRALPVGKKDWK